MIVVSMMVNMSIKINAIQHLKFQQYIGIIHRVLILTTTISLVKQSLAIDLRNCNIGAIQKICDTLEGRGGGVSKNVTL